MLLISVQPKLILKATSIIILKMLFVLAPMQPGVGIKKLLWFMQNLLFIKERFGIFTLLERPIYFDKTGSIVWFDELLNTQMKICSDSGVLVKQGENWKVQQ